ncbi:MAG: cation transporter [Deltaproteobacteria bacterium]|nr:cation transporter [Deltaproteobacteria bacterium]
MPGDEHQHEQQHRAALRHSQRGALWGALIVLALFFGVEFGGGLWTRSLALVSDAGHLLTDVGAIALALIAQWFGGRPSDARRSYGYKRAEILAALFNGVTLWLIAALISIEALRRFFRPPEVASLAMVAIATVGMLAQLAVALILRRAQRGSLNVRGAYLHALTDVAQSVGVIGAGLLMAYSGRYWIDPAISLAIAALIFYGGGRLVLEASHVLLEGTPREIDGDLLLRALQQEDGVQRIGDLHVWSLTTGDNALSAHVVAAGGLDAAGREQLRGRLAQLLRDQFGLGHVTLQVEAECHLGDACGCSTWLADGAAGKAPGKA